MKNNWYPTCPHVLCPANGNRCVQSSAEFWLFAGSWEWITLLPCMFPGENLISVPRLCWESLRSTDRWLVGNKWLLNWSGGWFQKILLLLTLPPIHVYLTVCMSNLIMKECPQGSMVPAPLWHKRSGDKDKRSVYTQDAPSIMPQPTAFALEMVFHSTTLYSVLTVLGAGVIQSISHTLKETVPWQVHGSHHLYHLLPTLPNKSHYCLLTQTSIKHVLPLQRKLQYVQVQLLDKSPASCPQGSP